MTGEVSAAGHSCITAPSLSVRKIQAAGIDLRCLLPVPLLYIYSSLAELSSESGDEHFSVLVVVFLEGLAFLVFIACMDLM